MSKLYTLKDLTAIDWTPTTRSHVICHEIEYMTFLNLTAVSKIDVLALTMIKLEEYLEETSGLLDRVQLTIEISNVLKEVQAKLE